MSSETMDKPKIVFVLGAPGSGKGTQCANIVTEYKYVHLSAGDLLRAERNRPGSELAQTIEEHIQGGKIIPVAVTCSLIERAMNEQMLVSFNTGIFVINFSSFSVKKGVFFVKKKKSILKIDKSIQFQLFIQKIIFISGWFLQE